MEKKIKATFCLFTYNQAPFVREAIRSSFLQDYPHLQIVIIDDGSSDGTADIIREESDLYDGLHKLSVLIKPHNKGLADSVNKAIYELAEGEWLVFAAGDDVSLKDRTAKIVARALLDQTVTVIQSAVTRMNDRGDFLSAIQPAEIRLETTATNSVLGAAAAYHRPTLIKFPRIGACVIREDVVLTTRCLIHGRYAKIDEYLVKWRRHDNNISGKFGKKFFESFIFMNGKFVNEHSKALVQQMLDVAHGMLTGVLDQNKANSLLLQYANMIRKNQKRSGFFIAWDSGKLDLRAYVAQHPIYSIYALVLLAFQCIREKVAIFRR